MVLILAICITAVRQIVYIFVSIFLLNLSFKHDILREEGVKAKTNKPIVSQQIFIQKALSQKRKVWGGGGG